MEAAQFCFQIQQGVEMGRTSDITVRVEVQAGKIASVRLEGSAVQVMKGRLEVDLDAF